MLETLVTEASACVAAVDATFAAISGLVEGWRDAVERLVGRASGTPTLDDLDSAVEALTVPTLEDPAGLAIGAGFVAAPGFLREAEFHLAWWLGRSNTFGVTGSDAEVRRLRAVEDPSADDFRDYTALEWWRVPLETGATHITGPYVDYLCTDDYTLTLTMPVRFEDRIVGVVGADLYVTEVERTLLPVLRRVPGTATIVNASGRVVLSTDPHRATGTLVRGDRTGVPCGASSLTLLRD